AREYTCDRYGCAASGSREGALLGVSILAAGGRYGPHVNRSALARQRRDLRGALMLVGEWLGSHPPLAKRVWALWPDLDRERASGRVALAGLRVAIASGVVVIAGVAAVSAYLPRLGMRSAQAAVRKAGPDVNEGTRSERARRDLVDLKSFVDG